MLKKVAAFEDLINRGILKLWGVLVKVILSVTPKFVTKKVKRCRTQIIQIRMLSKGFMISSAFSLLNFISTWKYRLLQNIDKLIISARSFGFHQFVILMRLKLDSLKSANLKVLFKNRVIEIFNVLKSMGKHIVKPHVMIKGLSASLILFGGFSAYQSYNDIYQKEFPTRAPASVQEYDYRPEYKSFESRTIKIMNMKIPVEVANVREISSVTIDFTIRTTTRFSRLFLENYDYKLKDYFFTTVEPVISDFPLESEGKSVLKEKITEEVNNFLRENGVEGVVEEVEIVFIVAS